MATVPGDPNDTGNGRDPYGGIPPGLRPGYPELLMAAAIHKQQQDQQQKLAGDVIQGRFPSKEFIEGRKAMQEELGKQGLDPNPPPRSIMPLVPRDRTSMQFDPLDPKDDDDDAKPPPKPKPRPKKEKT